MRTRAGWLALAMTGGLALLPAAVQAQGGLDIGRANPVIPLPIYHDRPETGGFYTALEFIMFRQTRNLGPQLVATRGFVDIDGSVQAGLNGTFQIDANGNVFFLPGPLGPRGAFLGSNTPALRVSDLNGSDLTYAPGLAMTAGWRFGDGSALEFRYKQVRDAKYSVGAALTPPNGFGTGVPVGGNLEDTFLYSPVYNFPSNYAGPGQKTSLGNPGALFGIWNGSSEMTLEFVQRFAQSDMTYRVPVREDDVSRTSVIAGPRFAWIWQKFSWRTVDLDNLGNARPQDAATFTNIVSNRMYGPMLGCEHEWYLGRGVALTVHLDGAAFVNIVKERASYELGDRTTENKKSVTEYTFVPSANGELNLTWYPIEGVQIRFGWDSVVFMNTVDSPNPISFNFGQLGGLWQRKTFRYLDGINFGLALTF